MKRKKGGGGKLNRSAIIQARLDPKLHLAAEIMARSQRRTLSSLIEMLIEEAINKNKISAVPSPNDQVDVMLENSNKRQKITIKQAIDLVWSPEEADRFAMFALVLPDIMTTEEDLLWFHIKSISYFWAHFPIDLVSKSDQVIEQQAWPLTNQHGIVKEHLREHWIFLKDILEGNRSIEDFRLLAEKLPEGPQIRKPADYFRNVKRVDCSVE